MRFSGISTSAPNGVGSLGLNWTGLGCVGHREEVEEELERKRE